MSFYGYMSVGYIFLYVLSSIVIGIYVYMNTSNPKYKMDNFM